MAQEKNIYLMSVFQCDACGRTKKYLTDQLLFAMEKARTDGWKVEGSSYTSAHIVLCPDCLKKIR